MVPEDVLSDDREKRLFAGLAGEGVYGSGHREPSALLCQERGGLRMAPWPDGGGQTGSPGFSAVSGDYSGV